MNKSIKLAAIHSKTINTPEEANPYSEKFDSKAPKAFINLNTDKSFEFLHQAGKDKVDLVCTHEDFKGNSAFMGYLDYPEIFSALVEEIPGPTTYRLAEIAIRYDMNISANMYEKEGESFYNTSVLIDRTGKLLGKYRKVHLPPSEKWRVSAGKEFPVFASDIGNIGFATCYDIIFPEHCRAVALNGADLIIHQTMGWGIGSGAIGEALVRTRAAENCVYMIVAKNKQNDLGKSCIIDNIGNIIAESAEENVVSAEITPDFDLIQEGYYNSLFSGVNSLKVRTVLERVPSLYSALSDQFPPLLDQHKGVALSDTPEKILEIFGQLKEYDEALKTNKPVKIQYHW